MEGSRGIGFRYFSPCAQKERDGLSSSFPRVVDDSLALIIVFASVSLLLLLLSGMSQKWCGCFVFPLFSATEVLMRRGRQRWGEIHLSGQNIATRRERERGDNKSNSSWGKKEKEARIGRMTHTHNTLSTHPSMGSLSNISAQTGKRFVNENESHDLIGSIGSFLYSLLPPKVDQSRERDVSSWHQTMRDWACGGGGGLTDSRILIRGGGG